MSDFSRNVLWVEKYRPTKITDCVLSEPLKKMFKDIISNEVVPNMLFCGKAGCGKTTVAKAICEELGIDYLFINASEDGNIDTLRTKIRQFASTNSLSGGRKMVILDEADHLNPQSTQPALRGFIEEFSSNCGFIFTCNFANKIISPLHSRCTVIEFKFTKAEKIDLITQVYSMITGILEKESITYDDDTIQQLIVKWFPDIRRIINELQRYSVSGTIDPGILVNLTDQSITKLVDILKTKKFNDMRKWVVDNLDNDSATIYRSLYDNLLPKLKETSIPTLILVIADYMYKSAFSVDSEINLVACLTQIMCECEFK